MKKLLSTLILTTILCMSIIYRNEIITYVLDKWIYTREISLEENNNYAENNNYQFIQLTDNFYPNNKQQLQNIIYTYLNNGWQEFTFYCGKEYENCLSDIKDLINNNTLLSHINNFVHPYNSYNKLFIQTNNLGKITLEKSNLYTEEEIQILNQIVDNILVSVTNDQMNNKEKIKAIHDYIINHTVYDQENSNLIKQNIETSEGLISHKASGPLISGIGLCGGYSDAMAIFLNKLGIQNYKIANDTHVWNLVNLDGTWYHLDLTWDDPVLDTKENILIHDFFLISTEQLHQKDPNQHLFNTTIYKEAN